LERLELLEQLELVQFTLNLEPGTLNFEPAIAVKRLELLEQLERLEPVLPECMSGLNFSVILSSAKRVSKDWNDWNSCFSHDAWDHATRPFPVRFTAVFRTTITVFPRHLFSILFTIRQ
jgi:hypothetical protein